MASNDSSPRPSTDVFSMSDDALANRYTFCSEKGVGNWGSVWIGVDKRSSNTTSSKDQKKEVAIKVVHRTKTQTTAARVRALWNEMKVVKPFKEDGHPSIVNFDCFIITPSYALIVMNYLPKMLPVRVEEAAVAKPWFASLASAVQFMHKRGVVHNDIKPANILLSENNVPIFVDFGFAERYDLDDTNVVPPFRSSHAYGTPEYLSPERARGQLHDTRKSDIWSLGVTFFEIVTGRTPFEHLHGESFTSKEELDLYWARTIKGEWLSTEGLRKVMSVGLESLLRKMLAPNADVRITAEEVMAHPYWNAPTERKLQKRPSAVLTDPATPQSKISSAVRTVLGSRQNVSLSVKSNENERRTVEENGSDKENLSPTIRKMATRQYVKDGLVTPVGLPRKPSNVRLDSQGVKPSLPVVQEAARMKKVIEENGFGRMASPPFATQDPPSPSPSPFTRPRANQIFSESTNRAIGNSASLDAPHGLRHAVSANYPFNATNIDGVGVRVVVENEAVREVRKIKSDLATSRARPRDYAQKSSAVEGNSKCHRKTPSYNSLYLGHSRGTSVQVIPEARSEESDTSKTLTPPREGNSILADTTNDTVVYYERVLENSNAVERVGQGYQSNLCTRNDPSTQKKAILPSEKRLGISKQLPPSSFFMTSQERGVPTRSRKMRQAASFDGFANLRPRTALPTARPMSANFDNTALAPTPASTTGKEKEKKKSTVTGTMRKAFLALWR